MFFLICTILRKFVIDATEFLPMIISIHFINQHFVISRDKIENNPPKISCNIQPMLNCLDFIKGRKDHIRPFIINH